jgi:hypothetical protein
VKVTLSKAEKYVLIEAGLFMVGSVFLIIAAISAGTAAWALWIGLIIALSGGVMWAKPHAVRLYKQWKEKHSVQKQEKQIAETEKIQESLQQRVVPPSGATPIIPPVQTEPETYTPAPQPTAPKPDTDW